MTVRAFSTGVAVSVLLATVWMSGCGPGASHGDRDGHVWGRSDTPERSDELTLTPINRIVHEAINESSGLIRYQAAYWTHNDSGDTPRLFRSSDLSFRDATVLTVPGAEAIDWEELTTFRGDLLICDTGDNKRTRDFVTLYQVRPTPGDRLALIATFRIAYPDGRHDAEACFAVEDTLYIVNKDRGEGTHVYAWRNLRPDSNSIQVGERVGTLQLEPGEQITAADCAPTENRVCLLSYSALLTYPLDQLSGSPQKKMRIWARQAESLCLDGGDLIFGNEQREVYRISAEVEQSPVTPSAALPPMVTASWPDEAWRGLPLQSLLRGENLEWRRIRDGWELRANIRFDDQLRQSDIEGPSLGAGVCLSFAPDLQRMPTRSGGDETHLVVVRGETGVELWRVWLGRPGGSKFRAKRLGGWPDQVRDGRWSWTIVVPLGEIEALEETGSSRFDVHGIRLRGGDEQLFLRAPGRYALERPYAWGRIE